MKLGKLSIKLISQQLVTSKKLVRNKREGKVLFEKYSPPSSTIFLTGGTLVYGEAGIVYGHTNSNFVIGSNRTVLGSSSKSEGGYDISGEGSFILRINKKPNLLRRKLIKILLGWDYIEKDKI